MKRAVRTCAVLGTLTGALAVGACSSTLPEPGEYKIFRIAAGTQTLSSGCATNMGAGESSSNLRTSGTFMLFADTDETTFYLDIGANTLDGEFDGNTDAGDEYQFSATSSGTSYSCSDGTGDKRTATTRLTIDMIVKDEFVSGTMKATTTFACVGPGCGEAIPECTITADFVGNEILDVQLEEGIGTGDPAPIPIPQPGVPVDPDTPPVGTGGSCAPTCNHNECEIGGPLDPTCNVCANEVCTMGNPSCCIEGSAWDENCISQADSLCDPTNFDHCTNFP